MTNTEKPLGPQVTCGSGQRVGELRFASFAKTYYSWAIGGFSAIAGFSFIIFTMNV
jgi:hypothetical protein